MESVRGPERGEKWKARRVRRRKKRGKRKGRGGENCGGGYKDLSPGNSDKSLFLLIENFVGSFV